eukprot:13385761-Alexandrium_andersonii.AAC.1
MERPPSGHRITSTTEFAEGGWRMAPEATEAYGEKAFRPEIGFEGSTEGQRGIMDEDLLNAIGPRNEEG